MSVDLLRLARVAGGGGGGGGPTRSGVQSICATYPQIQTGLRFAGSVENFGSETVGVTGATYSTVAPFTGLNNNVTPAANTSFDTNAMTDVATLVYVPTPGGLTLNRYYPLVLNGGATEGQATWLLYDSNGISFVGANTASNVVEPTTPHVLAPGAWYLLGLQVGPSNLSTYVNGSQVQTGTVTTWRPGGANPDIGGNNSNQRIPNGGTAAPIDGTGILISEVVVYSSPGVISPAPLNGTFQADAWAAYE